MLGAPPKLQNPPTLLHHPSCHALLLQVVRPHVMLAGHPQSEGVGAMMKWRMAQKWEKATLVGMITRMFEGMYSWCLLNLCEHKSI